MTFSPVLAEKGFPSPSGAQ